GAPADVRVSRWGGGLPQYTVGHLDRVARIRAAVAALPGLAVCGAAYDGIGIPACIASARLAADQVVAYLQAREARAARVGGPGGPGGAGGPGEVGTAGGAGGETARVESGTERAPMRGRGATVSPARRGPVSAITRPG